MWCRVAKDIASVEKDKEHWEGEFYNILYDFKFIPGGRILSGAGNEKVTYFNCYVLPSPEDSRQGIMKNITDMVEVMSRGGGVGVNLSTLRPRGAYVKGVNGYSSGVVSWGELYSQATGSVCQGGCFAPDVKILTNKGLMVIKEIIESNNKYEIYTHKGYKKIVNKFNNGIKPIYRVETIHGYSVDVTEDHKFLTYNNNGDFFLKPLKNLTINDNLVILLGNVGNNDYIDMNTNIPKRRSIMSTTTEDIILPKILNEKLAFILGMYMSNGNNIKDEYSDNGKGINIAVAINRPETIKLLKEYSLEIFSKEPTVSKGDGELYNLSIYSVQLSDYFCINNFKKQNAKSVFVPKQIFISPKSVIEAFISGYFSGDGSNKGSKGGFCITTISKQCADDIQKLLLMIGIPSRINFEDRTKYNRNNIYSISVNGNEYMKIYSNILKYYTSKVKDKNISKKNGSYMWDFNVLDRYSNIKNRLFKVLPSVLQKTSRTCINHIGEYEYKLNESQLQHYTILKNCVSTKIKKISFLKTDNVYDLEVEDVHLLSGNGFYTSNSRRGALLLGLCIDHPDIEEFITAKKDLNKLTNANLSVLITDDFMEAVKNEEKWDLKFNNKVYKTVEANYLWDLICESAWRSGEPGIIFIDRYNRQSNSWYFEDVICCNPCGEQGLPSWGICDLGSINLSKFVCQDSIDWIELKKVIQIAIRFLDNVIDRTPYFFDENQKTQKNSRRIGLGSLGLADALIKLKIKYGSRKAIDFCNNLYKFIAVESYKVSIDLAEEKGMFPNYEFDKYFIENKNSFANKMYNLLPKEYQKKAELYGIRNTTLLTQAPTGSTGMLADTSSSIEPNFAFEIKRKDRLGEHIIKHSLYQQWLEENSNSVLPKYFVTAQQLTPEEHVKMQSIVQKWVDSSISKTLNAPSEHKVDDVKNVYMLSYDEGNKGITYYRDNSRDEQVLNRLDDNLSKSNLPRGYILPALQEAKGHRIRLSTGCGHLWLMIFTDDDNNIIETFVNTGSKGGCSISTQAMSRLASLALRGGVPIKDVIDQLESAGSCPSYQLAMGKGNKLSPGKSCPSAIAKALERLQKKLNKNEDNKEFIIETQNHCPECKEELRFIEGCISCPSCGYSKCN
jgi:ribonucleoside-diphosphate reductase alpha chain